MTQIATLPDLRETLASEVADIGLSIPLPQTLNRYLLELASKPYFFSDPGQCLKMLAFAFQHNVLRGAIAEITGPWLRAWQVQFARCDFRQGKEKRAEFLAIKDDIHSRISLIARTWRIFLGRFAGPRTSLLLLLIKIDYVFFVRTGASKTPIARPWLWFMRKAFRILEAGNRVPWLPNLKLWIWGVADSLPPSGLRVLKLPRITGTRYDVLVTRVQGGIGDVIAMRPGLIQLTRRHRRGRVVFATARAYFPAFSIDDNVDLIDIERTEIDLYGFGKWVNMSDCPAVKAEIKELPRIRTGRVDLFGRALGVRFLPFSRNRVRAIRFATTVDAAAAEFLKRECRPEAVRIAIQLRSAENYKDIPVMLDVARALAERHDVFVFDNRQIPRRWNDRFISVDDQPMPIVMAMVSKMDAVVAPDSSFIHIAGCNSIPCLGLFGPSDGRVRRKPYPTVRYLDSRTTLACIPCWRNEDSKCQFGDGLDSICLRLLAVSTITDAVERLLRVFPPGRNKEVNMPAKASLSN
jgi:hypothetical protein